MHLIVCIDDRDGIAFCGRRLSRDREVSAHILSLAAGCNLWMHPYSAQLFPNAVVLSDPEFLSKAQSGDYCFSETTPLPDRLDNLESVILYHWNRSYPSNLRFPRSLIENMKLVYTEDFPGNSHDNITMEQYTL